MNRKRGQRKTRKVDGLRLFQPGGSWWSSTEAESWRKVRNKEVNKTESIPDEEENAGDGVKTNEKSTLEEDGKKEGKVGKKTTRRKKLERGCRRITELRRK
jgi:hypothetical protein